MAYSSKLSVHVIEDFLLAFGVEYIVHSPGSRNAPFAIHFFNHPKITSTVIVDERSAAFYALGIAKATHKPVALCCTSGTAVVNYYPALIEAFYSNIPLIVLSADRPSSFVDIFDGQTIRQEGIFSKHIRHFLQVPDNKKIALEMVEKIHTIFQVMMNELTPIHLNFEFDEPLYDTLDDKVTFFTKGVDFHSHEQFNSHYLIKKFSQFSSVVVLVGMFSKDEELENLLEKWMEKFPSVQVLSEATSNLSSKKFVKHIDRILFDEERWPLLQPDLVITLGQNVVSKKVKSFLRNYPPKEHWHVDEHWHPDTFFCLKEKIIIHPKMFLKELLQSPAISSEYQLKWQSEIMKTQNQHEKILSAKNNFSDWKVFRWLEHYIPNGVWKIHFSNSTPIRYAQLFDFCSKAEIFCNRGTSGIDGCTSTAAGFAFASREKTLLVTGDLGFFYDHNALWNESKNANFGIVLIHNGGGDIFNIIPGPKTSEALDSHFLYKNRRKAKQIAKDFKIPYYFASSEWKTKSYLKKLLKGRKLPFLLEIDTSSRANDKILKEYFRGMSFNQKL